MEYTNNRRICIYNTYKIHCHTTIERIYRLLKLLEKKKKKKKKNKPLLWQEPVPTENQVTFCVNYNDQGDAFYQPTHTVGTKHGYHIDASQKHTTSEQRRVYVDVTPFCATLLRRCMLTGLKQFILLIISVLLK